MSISKRLQDIERRLNRRGVELEEKPPTKPPFIITMPGTDPKPTDEEIEEAVRRYYETHPKFRGDILRVQ